MPFYRALLCGENFLVEFDGVVGRYGFYTTRYIEAENPDGAEAVAVQSLRDDGALREVVKNPPDDPPTLRVEQLAELPGPEDSATPGLAWYRMDPAKRWWQLWKR